MHMLVRQHVAAVDAGTSAPGSRCSGTRPVAHRQSASLRRSWTPTASAAICFVASYELSAGKKADSTFEQKISDASTLSHGCA